MIQQYKLFRSLDHSSSRVDLFFFFFPRRRLAFASLKTRKDLKSRWLATIMRLLLCIIFYCIRTSIPAVVMLVCFLQQTTAASFVDDMQASQDSIHLAILCSLPYILRSVLLCWLLVYCCTAAAVACLGERGGGGGGQTQDFFFFFVSLLSLLLCLLVACVTFELLNACRKSVASASFVLLEKFKFRFKWAS